MTDLNVYDGLVADTPIPVPLRDPNGRVHMGADKKPITFRLLPPRSEALANKIDDITDRKRAQAELETLSREQIRAYAYAQLAAYITGWTENFTLDGEAVRYSEGSAIRLVTRLSPLRELLTNWGLNQGNAWSALLDAQKAGRNGEAGSTDQNPQG